MGNLLMLLLWLAIWFALYQGREEAQGITFAQMVTYTAVSQMLMSVNGAGMPLWILQERVRTGEISSELIRPFDLPLRFLADELGSVCFYFLTAVLPLYTVIFWLVHAVWPDPVVFLLFTCSALIGFFIRWSIEFTFGLFTFWLIETGGVEDVFYFSISLLSGSLVPLWFFPGWLAEVATLLPFQAIFFLPNAIFVGEIAGREIVHALLLQLVWLGVVYLVMRLTWRLAQRKVVIQGG